MGFGCQLSVVECQDKGRWRSYSLYVEESMDLQIKMFHWPDMVDDTTLVARGVLDVDGLEQIFAAARPLLNCRALIDLSDATYKLEPVEIDGFVNGLTRDLWPQVNKIALLSTPKVEQYAQLYLLSACLSNRGFKIAAFRNLQCAVDWLAA
jgi:hypothetical protein